MKYFLSLLIFVAAAHGTDGRLLYIHDAPKMNAMVIDVERVK